MLFPKEIFDLILKKDKFYFQRKVYDTLLKKFKAPEYLKLNDDEYHYYKDINGIVLLNSVVDHIEFQVHKMSFYNDKTKRIQIYEYN